MFTVFQKEESSFKKKSCWLKKSEVCCLPVPPDPVYRSAGHLWLWGLWEQQFWTVLYQLRQRTASALFQPTHLQTGAGRVMLLFFLSFSFLQTIIIVQPLITRHCFLCVAGTTMTLNTCKHSNRICFSTSAYAPLKGVRWRDISNFIWCVTHGFLFSWTSECSMLKRC